MISVHLGPHRLRKFVFIGFLLAAAVTLLYTLTYVHVPVSPPKWAPMVRERLPPPPSPLGANVDAEKTVCQLPRLELNSPSLSGFFKSVEPLDCGQMPDWICVADGKARLCDQVAAEHPHLSCVYSFFDRVSDHTNDMVSQVVTKSADVSVTLVTDFFNVSCVDEVEDANHLEPWSNLMMGVHFDDKISRRNIPNDGGGGGLGLNVLVIGFDSLSRLTFMRKLPRSYEYMTTELNAVVLKGYNIVGDGTPQALIPILTGFAEPELPETRKRMGNLAAYVNVYPFVWHDFQSAGYVTAYAEDTPSLGTFTYRLKGFDDRPTDHYLRPFYVEYDNVAHHHRKLCIGARPAHKVMLDWAVEYFDVYRERPKFFFGFQGALSHDDVNLVEVADVDFQNFLKMLKKKGHLNNTMLIVMSDHGHRFSALRETQQGKQEERLPFFTIVLPAWFKDGHPKAWRNLQVNAERLTSPFDIHATFQSILHFKEDDVGKTSQRSISLFSQVPASRRCEDAGIEPHWCSCLTWEELSVDDPVVLKVAAKLIDYINGLTGMYRSLCHKLGLGELQRAEKYVPQSELLHFKKTSDPDGFEGDFSGNTTITEVFYQVKVTLKPGSSHFEASIIHRTDRNTFEVTEQDISRVNAYGSAARCIENVQPDLRKYCYCMT